MNPTMLVALLFVSSWMCLDTAYAVFEIPDVDIPNPFEATATFESFYSKSWTNRVIGYGVGILVAAALGAAVFFTGGVASAVAAPGTAAIGTLIGQFMGLSGAAATSAGLAFVGGGSIATGGLGMAGGAAVITATTGIASEVVIISGQELYHSRKKREELDALYDRLVHHGEGLITFPLPRNDSGSDALAEAMSELEDIDDALPLAAGDNRRLLKKAVSKLRWSPDVRQDALAALVHIEKADPHSSAVNQKSAMEAVAILLESSDVVDLRDAALLSLLYFVLNDCTKADHYAGRARQIAEEESPEDFTARTTLPTFIAATCALYEREVDYAAAMSQFKRSILSEPENKLVPLLFSIFLDRFTLRSMRDGHFDPQVFSEAFDIMKTPALEEFRLTNYIILLGRYLMHIENEKLKIRSIAGASDDAIRKHPKTLPYVNKALDAYLSLLHGASDVESNVCVLSMDELDAAQREAVAELRGRYTRAILEKEELASVVKELERQQEEE